MSDKKERSKSISFTSSNVDWEEDVKENVEGVGLIEDALLPPDKYFHVALSEEVNEIDSDTYIKMQEHHKGTNYMFGPNHYVLDANRKHHSKLIYIAEQHAKNMMGVE